MGNQLASSQQPDYNNLPDIGSALTFQERLGGGRFLKTLKCVNEDRGMVPTAVTECRSECRSESQSAVTVLG